MNNKKIINLLKSGTANLPITNLEQYINRYLVSNNLTADGAFYVTWNITNRCNLSCVYCSNENEHASDGEMKLNEKLKLINILAENNVKHIKLLGGEPTLSESFSDVLDSLLSHDFFTSFSTNGVGINKELINVLNKYSPKMYNISISLDSAIDINNDMNRGFGSSEVAKNAISLLMNHIDGVNLDIVSVITPNNKNDILKTYEYAKNIGIKRFGITLVLLSGRASNDMILDLTNELLNDLTVLVDLAKKDNIKICTMGLGYSVLSCYDNKDCNYYTVSDKDAEVIFRRKCNACITRLHIDSNGSVYPCDNLKYSEFYLGNILKDSYENIWNHKTAKQIRHMKRNEKEFCSKCPIKTCSTGCMGLSYAKYKTIYIKDPNCEVKIDV